MIMQCLLSLSEINIFYCFFTVPTNVAEGYRGLAQHGGPPGWLEESDPVILYAMDGPYACLFRTVQAILIGAA
jgi:hypothetical protein